jgi:O-antigen/teichoic acid export membrane protein
MLAVAPLALRAFGIDRFGIWMISNSAISIGAVVASGFGDANVRDVAGMRAVGDQDTLVRGVRTSMGIHLLLGTIMALAGWLLAPLITDRVVASIPSMRADCLWSLRIAASLTVVRAIETVCIGTQRAFERYGEAVHISVLARILSLIVAASVPLVAHSVTTVMIASAGVSLLSVLIQMVRLHALLDVSVLTPLLDAESTRRLLGCGIFTWIQAVSALLFGQVDRVITGVVFGAVAVSSYSLCAQLSQPIYGITAAGLHFLVPRISIQHALRDWMAIRRTVLLGFCVNLLMVVLGTAVLLHFGEAILRIWGGEEIARIGRSVLPLIVWSTALPALNVSGVYAMLVLGRVRFVTLLSLIAGAMMLVSVPWLLTRYGVVGMAYARMIYGPISLLVYIPLFRLILRGRITTQSKSDPAPELCEEGR